MEPADTSLTLNETRIARLVAEGRTDAEIASQLALALLEVERSVADALRKLGLRSRTELALLFARPAGANARTARSRRAATDG